jgi:imidazolonepropionase-like amidohydrolase
MGTAPLRDAHVVFNRVSIKFVGGGGRSPPAEFLRLGQDRPDLDVPDGTLLPGLTDAHAHLFLEGGELGVERRAEHLKRDPASLLADARGRLAKLVRLGVTAVRDAGDKVGVGLALSRLCSSEARPVMPYVESPGAAIHHRGRYGGFMARPLEDYASPQACVEARVANGADRIKLIPTGIINFGKAQVTSEPQMSTDEIAQLVSAAQSLCRQTFAHASGDTGIDRVIDGNVDSVEHGFFVRDDQLARMRDRRTAWVPTFAPVQAQLDHAPLLGWNLKVASRLRGILERHASSLTRAHAMGVMIVAGSDAGSFGVAHGLGLLREMELMERAGLPPIAVINAATGVGTSRFGYKEKFGLIKPGYLSRFILTKYSPLESVSNLRKPRRILFDGDVFDAGEETATEGL